MLVVLRGAHDAVPDGSAGCLVLNAEEMDLQASWAEKKTLCWGFLKSDVILYKTYLARLRCLDPSRRRNKKERKQGSGITIEKMRELRYRMNFNETS